MTTKIPAELSSTPGISDSSNATAITIDSSENIATSGTFQVGASSGANLLIDSSSDVMQVKVKKDGTDDIDLAFLTQASGGTIAEKMRITSDGKLGIGITAPDEKLQVNGKLKVSSSFGTNTSVIIQNNDSSDNFSAIGFYSGGTVAGYIFVNGSTNATSYVTSSDYRLKENINYEFDALDRVKQLKPARFNFIADANTTVDGFIAHEVSDIVPEAITGEKDGEQMQGIDQSKLVPLLTKAIQEQQEIIEDLKSRIETLEG